jgi:transcriptional regulator with XRE-family HTH domain
MTVKLKKERFKEFMKAKGLTMYSIADSMNYTPSYVYMIFNEKRNPSSFFIAKLLKLSGYPFEYFFEVIDSKPNNDSPNEKWAIRKEHREEGKRGEKDEGGKLGDGGNTRVAGETVPTQDAHGDVRLQAASQPSVQAPKVSEKSAGAEPATTTI